MIINYYYHLHIYPGYPHHRSVFQWGPATLNYSILILIQYLVMHYLQHCS
jgi:hypothetical protein